MSDTNWTPGPWTLSPNQTHVRRTLHGFNVCEVNECLEEYNANAHLIAAAPDLYHALAGIMHYASMGAAACDVDTSEQPEFVAARAALAKARGEQ